MTAGSILSGNQLHTLGQDGSRNFYGDVQARTSWLATDPDEQQVLCEAAAPEYMWRLSAIGQNVVFQLTYGTRMTIALDNLLSPLVAFVPGRFSLQARRIDPQQAGNAECTLTAATGGMGSVKQIASVPGALLPAAARATALTAGAALTVGGVATVLAGVGDSVPLIAPATLVGGSIIVELAL